MYKIEIHFGDFSGTESLKALKIKGLRIFDLGSIPVDRTKQISTLHGCFFVCYDTDYSTGIEGGSRFVRTKRFALRKKDYENANGKVGN